MALSVFYYVRRRWLVYQRPNLIILKPVRWLIQLVEELQHVNDRGG